MTRQELAEAAQTSVQQLARLGSGERRMTVDWLMRLAAGLGCSSAELLDEGVPHDSPAELASVLDAIKRHWKALDYARRVFANDLRRRFPELDGGTPKWCFDKS